MFAQLFDSNGAKTGSEFQANTETDNDQRLPDVESLVDGRFLVVWQSYGQDGDSNGVYAQAYGPDGVKDGQEFQVNTTTDGSQYRPKAACPTIEGDCTVTWMQKPPGEFEASIMGQSLNAEMTASGPEAVLSPGGSCSSEHYASVSQSTDKLVLAWDEFCLDFDYGEVWANWGTWDGSQLNAKDILGLAPVGEFDCAHEFKPDVDTAPGGSIVVVWSAQEEDLSAAVMCKLYDQTGSGVGEEFRADTYHKGAVIPGPEPRVTVLSDGFFVTVWASCPDECDNAPNPPGPQDGDACGIFAQRFAADGAKLYH